MMREEVDIAQIVVRQTTARFRACSLTIDAGGNAPTTRRLVVAFAFQSAASLTGPSFTLLWHSASTIASIVGGLTRIVVSIHYVSASISHIPSETTCVKTDFDSTRTSMVETLCEQQYVVQGALSDQSSDCRLDKHVDSNPWRGTMSVRYRRRSCLQTLFLPLYRLNGLRRRLIISKMPSPNPTLKSTAEPRPQKPNDVKFPNLPRSADDWLPLPSLISASHEKFIVKPKLSDPRETNLFTISPYMYIRHLYACIVCIVLNISAETSDLLPSILCLKRSLNFAGFIAVFRHRGHYNIYKHMTIHCSRRHMYVFDCLFLRKRNRIFIDSGLFRV